MAAVAAASEQVQEAVQAAPPAAKKATAKAAVQVINIAWWCDVGTKTRSCQVADACRYSRLALNVA